MKELLIMLLGISASQMTCGQQPDSMLYDVPHHYRIEDNSMFIEEAFNQDSGVIQFISTIRFNGEGFEYGYCQEIPLNDQRHQLSFTIPYSAIHSGESQMTSGFGDFLISYRPLLAGRNRWALVIPRITCIVPIGKSNSGLRAGGWGGAFNLAVTKSFARFSTHYNAGYAAIFNGNELKDYVHSGNHNIRSANLGCSAIWEIAPKFNLMLEYLFSATTEVRNGVSGNTKRETTINPAFRFAFDCGNAQIVPGIGVPFTVGSAGFGMAAFLYLSIEVAH